MLLSKSLCWHSKLSRSCKELYEGPGGNQVDGLPPAPVPGRALRRDELRGIPRRAPKGTGARAIRVQGGASWPARPEKKMCQLGVGFVKI